MNKKEITDFTTSTILFILASIILLFPTFKMANIKTTLTIIFGIYSLVKLIQFLFIISDKDYESLFTFIISLGSLLITLFINLNAKNLALILLIWVALMSLVKLKKADFYHDRKNKMWLLRLFMLIVFITSGLLTGMNLLYEQSVQILLIGYFFLINSILDIIDPITTYLMRNKN